MNIYKISRVPLVITNIIFILIFIYSLKNSPLSDAIMVGLITAFAIIVTSVILIYYKNFIVSVSFTDDIVMLKKSDGKIIKENRLECDKIIANGSLIKLCFGDKKIYCFLSIPPIFKIKDKDKYVFDNEHFPNAKILIK